MNEVLHLLNLLGYTMIGWFVLNLISAGFIDDEEILERNFRFITFLAIVFYLIII